MFETDDFNFDDNLFTNLPDSIRPANENKDENRSPKPSTSSNFNSSQNPNRKEMTKKNSNSRKVVLKRKFPGPAGLFPESNEPLDINKGEDDQSMFVPSTQFFCSQNSNLTFQEATWQDMCKDFNNSELLKKYDVEWIKRHVAHNFINKKVPFLAGIIKEVKNTSKTPIFILADQTGEIEALVSTELYEEYNEFLTSNSVLILKQFSILSINPCKHYVNITIDNLVRIYSCKDASQEYVKIAHIKEISIMDLERDITEFVNKYQILQNDSKKEQFSVGIRTNNVNVNKFLSTTGSNNSYMRVKDQNLSRWQNSNDTLNLREVNTDILHEKNTNSKIQYTENCHGSSDALLPTTNVAKNIFEHSNNFCDLELAIDDFKDDFSLQNVKKTFSNPNDAKKRKVNMSDSKPNVTKNIFNVNDERNDNKNCNSNKLDCTQISIISQNSSEHPDIIKEVFSGLDTSALFDDF
ncbi:hypothetical protein Trydic_g2392 [Trypoxylus dichotomus]